MCLDLLGRDEKKSIYIGVFYCQLKGDQGVSSNQVNTDWCMKSILTKTEQSMLLYCSLFHIMPHATEPLERVQNTCKLLEMAFNVMFLLYIPIHTSLPYIYDPVT